MYWHPGIFETGLLLARQARPLLRNQWLALLVQALFSWFLSLQAAEAGLLVSTMEIISQSTSTNHATALDKRRFASSSSVSSLHDLRYLISVEKWVMFGHYLIIVCPSCPTIWAVCSDFEKLPILTFSIRYRPATQYLNKAAVDSLLQFNQPVGYNYSGRWLNRWVSINFWYNSCVDLSRT